MALLLETTLGDLTIDLDVDGSPHLCRNIIKLAKARYYTNTLVYNVQQGRFCQLGDPKGDGTGGCCIYGLIDATLNKDCNDVTKSTKRFLRSEGRMLHPEEQRQKGRVVAMDMGGILHTIGSQFLITLDSGEGRALDGLSNPADNITPGGVVQKSSFLSLGVVTEDDDNVLEKINGMYCDREGRPFADVRIIRAHVLDDPYDDPPGLDDVLQARGVTLTSSLEIPDCPWIGVSSPDYSKPNEEIVEERIGADEALRDDNEDGKTIEERDEERKRKEDKSRAAVLEMLGDLPSADMKPPENVLFVCKLNPITEDEDLELIFSRFDPNAKADIIRDPDTGDSLQYAFVEFTTKEQCNEAYFKMNNALVDDRRIKVDFSQSVAKEWNRYTQKRRGNVRREGTEGRSGRGGPPGISGREKLKGWSYDRDDRRQSDSRRTHHATSDHESSTGERRDHQAFPRLPETEKEQSSWRSKIENAKASKESKREEDYSKYRESVAKSRHSRSSSDSRSRERNRNEHKRKHKHRRDGRHGHVRSDDKSDDEPKTSHENSRRDDTSQLQTHELDRQHYDDRRESDLRSSSRKKTSRRSQSRNRYHR